MEQGEGSLCEKGGDGKHRHRLGRASWHHGIMGTLLWVERRVYGEDWT